MKNEILNLIKENLIEIMPELEGKEVSEDETLVNLGANSIDRGELITLTLERLDLDVSRIEFVGAHTINELADLIVEKRK
ncbi:acyl carrier protein [Flavobacterium sp. H122]|uniref:acyl carrier protein n=1 Tax=Flavobacterium sp. H122 TaxID=2529860 RepID=UPI0010AB3BE5|nr:acyl carrier protein [Flavobacterium sp. H122]